MYNAKEIDNSKENDKDAKSKVVGERSYFEKGKNENMLVNKASYIPTENIFY